MSNGGREEAFLAMCETPDYEMQDLVDDGPEDYERSPYNGDDLDGGAHDFDDTAPDTDRDGDFEEVDDRDTDDDRDPPEYE